MTEESKRLRTMKKICVIVGFIMCLAISVINAVMNVRFPGGISIGTVQLTTSSLLGSLQALNFIICILMVRSGLRFGYVLSLISLAFSLAGCLKATLSSPDHGSLPGVFSAIVFLFAITIIFRRIRQLRAASHTELITGLFNRRGIIDKMEEFIAKDIHFDFVSICIDNFNELNSGLGFIGGDMLFRELGHMIDELVGDETEAIVGTFDRNTFDIILTENTDNVRIISDLIHRITQPITIENEGTPIECHVTAYAGMATYPDHSDKVEEIIKYSDLAMRHCCKVKKHFFEMFNENLKDDYLRENYVEQAIRYGIDHNTIYMVFQPFFNIADRRLAGFEALARLEDSDGIIIDTTEFITVAEKSDLIVHFDKYIIRHTLSELAKEIVEKHAQIDNSISISINLSAKTLDTIGIVDFIFESLNEKNIPKDYLTIEITEYSFAFITDTIKRNIEALISGGIKVAIDDFGTGYTSLSHLVQIPFSILKIDREIVSGIEFDCVKRDIVNSVISVGHVLGCRVVCEGVETSKQVELLREAGCDIIQGFIWGRPVTFEDGLEMVREDMTTHEATK